jgi:hypothetical protein
MQLVNKEKVDSIVLVMRVLGVRWIVVTKCVWASSCGLGSFPAGSATSVFVVFRATCAGLIVSRRLSRVEYSTGVSVCVCGSSVTLHILHG